MFVNLENNLVLFCLFLRLCNDWNFSELPCTNYVVNTTSILAKHIGWEITYGITSGSQCCATPFN